MSNNICHKFLHLVLSFLSFFLLCQKTTAVNPLGQQLVAVGGGETGTYKCIDEERRALLYFKAHVHQDPYGLLSTWTNDDEEATNDCCEDWSGVTCNNQGHVTSLYLKLGDLKGKISPSLLNLSYLNDLDLSSNFFNGTIPTFIGSMTQLKYLDLGWNDFTGTIPLELGNLTNLQKLSLGNLTGCTIENLDWLSYMSQLEDLCMDGISLAIADNWVNVILSLRNLSVLSMNRCELSQVMHPYSSFVNSNSSSIVTLHLGNNNLNSSMYHWLFPLTSNRLEDLRLTGNKLDGIPKYLGNLCGLLYFSFDNNSKPIKFPDFLNNLSGCTSLSLTFLFASSSQFIGSLSDDIQTFSSLQYLGMSNNQLNGTISDKVWQLPKLVDLDVSSNSFKGAIPESIGKSTIPYIDLSNNSFEGVPPEAHISNLSYVELIDLNSCKLGPHFPKWIQTFKNLSYLDISNTGISDKIPEEFWNTWPSQLTYLNLSSNNITGNVKDLSSNFNSDFSILDLSSNNFSGPILSVPSSLNILDLYRNNFYGEISFLCQIVDGALFFLDLSHNSFTGQIPDCLWHFQELEVLSLGHNNLSGRLPASIQYLINLEVLNLYNNSFSGELPLSLQKCIKITFLELGANKFSGHVPAWIGEKLTGLYALRLTSNTFFGTIPLQLCQLAHLQILDLSMNELYGTIPPCLSNLTAMVQDGVSSYHNVHTYFCRTAKCMNKGGGTYTDHAIIKWQGKGREFSSNLRSLTIIDLSSNNLTGQIPYELVSIRGLIALNLSHNGVFGEIPQNIGQMEKLLTLDLSRNNLSGDLPPSLSELSLLNYLDVSYNKLSGRIPSSTQLQSFEPSRYTGNAQLCGPPLTKHCPGDKELEAPELVGKSEGEDIYDIQKWFYIGGASGFATGFWIACGALLVNWCGSKAFFRLLDSLKGWIYLKVMVFTAKWQ